MFSHAFVRICLFQLICTIFCMVFCVPAGCCTFFVIFPCFWMVLCIFLCFCVPRSLLAAPGTLFGRSEMFLGQS